MRSPFVFARAAERELMDDEVENGAELRANLREIARLNRLLGTTADVVRFARDAGARTVLDVGAGLGDIALALVRAQRGINVTCLDRSAQMIGLAREYVQTSAQDDIAFVQGDGLALPFEGASFDLAMCNLALHHFDPPLAEGLLRELRRVGRRVLVTDLVRSPLLYAGACVAIGIASRNRLTRHDGPLSVRRAYTPDEAVALARAAGWRNPTLRKRRLLRMLLFDG